MQKLLHQEHSLSTDQLINGKSQATEKWQQKKSIMEQPNQRANFHKLIKVYTWFYSNLNFQKKINTIFWILF